MSVTNATVDSDQIVTYSPYKNPLSLRINSNTLIEISSELASFPFQFETLALTLADEDKCDPKSNIL